MFNDQMNLLAIIDENYINPFRVMMKSISINNPNERFQVFLFHDAIDAEALNQLIDEAAAMGITLHPFSINI